MDQIIQKITPHFHHQICQKEECVCRKDIEVAGLVQSFLT